MKNRQLSPTHRFFMRPEKQTLASHNSGSTIETSDHKMAIKPTQDKGQSQLPSKEGKVPSQTISVLRKQLKNIKMEVTKLIEEGFVKATLPAQWLQSSGNMSSLSRSSKVSGAVVSEFYGQNQLSKRKSDLQRNSFVFSYEEMMKLREQCEHLKNLYEIKEKKQAEILQKQKQLFEQVKALRKCKQQLSKCIQILQASLKETNTQMNNYIQQSSRLQEEIQKSRYENQFRENDFLKICSIKNRLEEELEYRKAQNNELIKIIEFKEGQVEELKINYSSQLRAMQIQHRRAFEEFNSNYDKERRARSVDPRQPYTVQRYEIERLQNQIQNLRTQLANRQKVMVMMLNDIKTMDKELLASDEEHKDLLRCRHLIEELNEKLIILDAKRVSNKYKYC